MDRIMQRVRMAERHAARRPHRPGRRKRFALVRFERNSLLLRKGAKQDIKDAQKARRDEWEMGPIAPRRDFIRDGEDGDNTQYGTVNIERALLRLDLWPEEQLKRTTWAGGTTFLCLVKGDRVVVTEGWMKGRVDKVAEIDTIQGWVMLESAQTNVTAPSFLRDEIGLVSTLPLRVPINAVRLVHPIKDEETGITKDMIIRELKPIKIRKDNPTKSVTWSRMVPGLNVTIPWPKVERRRKPDYPVDTQRILVEERTFIPTLLTPPMPEVVLDELRGRYSKFRTRHTEEYIAKVEAQEAAKHARKEQAREMLTPVQEFNRAQRELRRARGQPVLTDEILAKIGEVMAKNMNARSEAKRELSLPAKTAVAARASNAPLS